MKFNWGHGLIVFFVLFIGTLVFVLIKSFDNDNSLVADDYYAKDLSYQEQYNKEKNYLAKQHATLEYKASDKKLFIHIDTDKTVLGDVVFYNPADKTKDFTKRINSKDFEISTADLAHGRWEVSIDWKENGKPYFVKKSFFL